MNKRIEDLKGKALDQAVPYTWHHLNQVQIDDVLNKFAELIVGECMAMCKTSVGNADYNTGRLHCLNNIKEHFGVNDADMA